MKSEPLVSMIMPVYNKRAYLKPSVDSLRTQTYKNLEIILVDDGSTDGSGELCDAFAREDSRIRVIHQENGGVSSARNTGLDAMRGKYVFFVDGDDQVLDTMVEEMAAVLEREGCDLCVGGIQVLDEKDASKSFSICCPKPAFFQFRTLHKKRRFLCRRILCVWFGWSACIQMWRRDIIERHHLRFKAGQKIYEDMDFFFRYAAHCQNLRCIPQIFYIYYQHNESAMHTSNRRELIDWMLRLTSEWKHAFNREGEVNFPPVYVCAGLVYVKVFVNEILRTEGEKRQAVQTIEVFRASEHREWLLEQARLAVKNWPKVLWFCGLGLGLRVYGFYKSLLTGDMSAFYRVNQLRLRSEFFYLWKKAVIGRKREKRDAV